MFAHTLNTLISLFQITATMLTPAFELRQDKDYLTVIIKAPFAKVPILSDLSFQFYSRLLTVFFNASKYI